MELRAVAPAALSTGTELVIFGVLVAAAALIVAATTFAAAAVAHAAIHGLSWEAAIVLGAVVSPTDPVAATAIAARLSVPRRVVTIVEGESLINDATALILYRFAVAAVVTGSF